MKSFRGSSVSFCDPSTSGRCFVAPISPLIGRRRTTTTASAVSTNYQPDVQIHEKPPEKQPWAGYGRHLGGPAVDYDSMAGDVGGAKRLTAQIRRAQSWQDLEELLMHSQPSCNFIHLCAAISQLSRLMPLEKLDEPLETEMEAYSGGLERQRFRVFGHWLLSQIFLCIPVLRPREISNVLGSIAKLGLRPDLELLDDLCSATLLNLGHFCGQDLGSTAWALAKMGYLPSPSWLSAFSSQCELCVGGMDSQALSNLFWAYARWDVVLPRHLVLGVTGEIGPDGRILKASGPQALSNILWGLARQRCCPDEDWMTAYWEAVHCHTVAMTEERRPEASSGHVRACGRQPRPMSASELSRVFFAAGKVGARVPHGSSLMGQLVSHLADKIDELGFAECTHALWGLSHLELRDRDRDGPGGDALREVLLPRWYEHTKRLLDSFVTCSGGDRRPRMLDGQVLGNALYAVHRLEHPRADEGCSNVGSGGVVASDRNNSALRSSWLRSAVTACTALMEANQMDAQALAVSGLCIAKLDPVSAVAAAADGEWCAAFAAAVQLRVSSMNSAEVANVVCALSRIRHLPSPGQMVSLTSHVQSEMVRFKPHELATTLLALARLSSALGKHEMEMESSQHVDGSREEAGRQGRWRAVSRGIWAALLSDAGGWLDSLPPAAVTERDIRVMRRVFQVVGWQGPLHWLSLRL